jgi:hypothetical protein
MTARRQLAELQQWFLSAVTQRQSGDDPDVTAVVSASRQQTADQRLDVYRRAYFARLLEVLREQFPCTRFAVGGELFDQFALGYLERHPPNSYTLARLADRLVDHLSDSRPSALPWGGFLVELAALEQAIDRVFDGPGPERMPRFALPAQPAVDIRLRLVPGCELHAFDYPVSTFFSRWKAGEQPAWPERAPQWVALFRRDYIVRRLELSALEYAMLAGLQADRSLAEAIAAAAAIEAAEGELAATVGPAFTRWAAAGLFSAAHDAAGR